MGEPELKEILHRYNTGQCTDEEKALIESWYLKLDVGNRLTEAQISEIVNMKAPGQQDTTGFTFSKWIPAAAAAAVILSIAGLLYWPAPVKEQPKVVELKGDVAPGMNKAILSLSGGKTIILDDTQTGDIAMQEDMVVGKNADGSIVYKPQGDRQGETTANLKNTMSTPRGGQYRLTLSDGTKVWLNAASSITYPVHFDATKREVEIEGEVYFEVTHSVLPFMVKSHGQVVEVLGTHFNISAYEDEPYLKTTLLEGSVRVKTAGGSKVLRPGQQSATKGQDIQTNVVDTEAEVAWKNGDFDFSGQPLKDLMRHIARWYDVQIDYKEYTERGDTFSGVISRSRNLSAVLKMLEKTNSVTFRIEGKRIYVNN